MKRIRIPLEAIAGMQNLALAATKAARGKRLRPDAMSFFRQFDTNCRKLSEDILAGRAPYHRYKAFTIHDPKQRTIHAACFEDRVLHHAVMNLIGPWFIRTMLPSSYACLPGKGTLAAVDRVQSRIRRYIWYVKTDIKSYFDSIDHQILLGLLARRFKGPGVLSLLIRIVAGYHTKPGKGLPIGALTSQYFANFYLAGLDRFLVEKLRVRAHVRYMDDTVWWCENLGFLKTTVKQVRSWLAEERQLELKGTPQIQRSRRGISFCGFRVCARSLKLNPRRKKRYRLARLKWEKAYAQGRIDMDQLQRGYAGVMAIVAHAESLAWRRKDLRRHPSLSL